MLYMMLHVEDEGLTYIVRCMIPVAIAPVDRVVLSQGFQHNRLKTRVEERIELEVPTV